MSLCNSFLASQPSASRVPRMAWIWQETDATRNVMVRLCKTSGSTLNSGNEPSPWYRRPQETEVVIVRTPYRLVREQKSARKKLPRYLTWVQCHRYKLAKAPAGRSARQRASVKPYRCRFFICRKSRITKPSPFFNRRSFGNVAFLWVRKRRINRFACSAFLY